jgi:hypothetical protein
MFTFSWTFEGRRPQREATKKNHRRLVTGVAPMHLKSDHNLGSKFSENAGRKIAAGRYSMKRSTEAPKKQNSAEDAAEDIKTRRELALDKTLADSFPASDPPSSCPNPEDEEDLAA